MNRKRKVLITITYNEMGIIIDTKAEEVAQPERPKGEWIVSGMEDDGRYMGSRWYACDQCGRAGDIGDNFCRGCGADMRGDKE